MIGSLLLPERATANEIRFPSGSADSPDPEGHSIRQRLQCFTENRMAAFQGPQPHQVDDQPSQADAPHHDLIRQNRPVLYEFPQYRRRKVLAQSFC